MRKRRGLSTIQKIFIFILWAALCVMLFTIPNGKSPGENIFYAVMSGVIILVGISAGQNKMNRKDRDK
jgi:hypothetical protein